MKGAGKLGKLGKYTEEVTYLILRFLFSFLLIKRRCLHVSGVAFLCLASLKPLT